MHEGTFLNSLIGTLAKERSDREVAAELNRRGLLSGVKRAWDKEAVRWVRKRYGIRRQPAGRRGGHGSKSAGPTASTPCTVSPRCWA